MAKKLFNLILICMISILFIGCGAGTNSILQNNTSTSYIQFSESNITLRIGESAEISAILYNANDNTPQSPLNIFSSESGIVLIVPSTCLFNTNYNPPNCTFLVTGIAAGSTQIIIDNLATPQQTLSVTVIP